MALSSIAILFLVAFSMRVYQGKGSETTSNTPRQPVVAQEVPPVQTIGSSDEHTKTNAILKSDIQELKAQFESGSFNDNLHFYLTVFAQRLAKEDVEGGLRWLLSLTGASEKFAAISEFARVLRSADPSRIDLAMQQEMPTPAHQALVVGAASGLLDNVEAASDYVRKCSRDKPEQDWIVRSLIMTLSQDHGKEGALRVMKMSDEFPYAATVEQYGSALFDLWIADKNAAMNLMNEKQDFQDRPGVYATFTEGLARRDLTFAADWVNSLAKGKAKDYAIHSIAKATSHQSSSDALRWAVTVQDDDLRPQAIHNILELSAYHDPKIAREIIQAAGFPLQETDKWMQLIKDQEARIRKAPAK